MRTSRLTRRIILVGAVLGLPSAAVAQRTSVPVLGRAMEVTLSDGQMVSGELISATGGSLLLSGTSGFQDVSFGDVSRVRARRHNMSSGKVMAWIGLGALVTGAGLAAACSQVEGASCGEVFPAVALSWGLVGGLAALGISGSRWQDLPVQRDQLSPYARFPQGAPPGFGR